MRCVGQAIIGHLPPLHIVPPGSAYICSRVFFGLYFNTNCVYQPFKKPFFFIFCCCCSFVFLSTCRAISIVQGSGCIMEIKTNIVLVCT